MSTPTISKTTSSNNVPPGTPVNFTVTLVIPANNTFLVSFIDLLPLLPSGSQYTIIPQSQSVPGFFEIVGRPGGPTGAQNLKATTGAISPETYTVTIEANTTEIDAGAVLSNIVEIQFLVNGIVGEAGTTAVATVAICIHGSSMISLPNNEQIEISKLQPGQLILGADGKPTNIIEVVPCWTRNDKCGNCIIFEKDSLFPNVPSRRFAVDAGHPICPCLNTSSYVPHLIPAKHFVNNKNIYIVNWEDVKFLLPGENKRYDIIMKDDSCKAYVANGIIVKARQERIIPGYSYV